MVGGHEQDAPRAGREELVLRDLPDVILELRLA